MISAYMGPHYGNNVTLPAAGHYQLTLLISPPVVGPAPRVPSTSG